jgi:hypothetical protein
MSEIAPEDTLPDLFERLKEWEQITAKFLAANPQCYLRPLTES